MSWEEAGDKDVYEICKWENKSTLKFPSTSGSATSYLIWVWAIGVLPSFSGICPMFDIVNFKVFHFSGPFILPDEQARVVSIKKLSKKKFVSISASFSICLLVLLAPDLWTKLMCSTGDVYWLFKALCHSLYCLFLSSSKRDTARV